MNRFIGIGRYTSDPKITYTQGGMCCASFTLAVDRKFRNKQGQKEADFITCKAFDKTAEVIEKYGAKGRQIAVEGHIQTGNYVNKDGQKVYTTDVIVDAMQFLDKKQDVQPDEIDKGAQVPSGFTEIADDVPF